MKRLLLLLFFVTASSVSQTGGALNFDGINDYVNLGSHSALNYSASSVFTIEFLVKPGSLLTSQTIVGRGSRTAGKGWIIRVLNNEITFRNRDVIIGGTTTAISPSVWSHVAVTYNNTSVKIYINGVLMQSGTLSITSHSGNHDMYIGARHRDDGSNNPNTGQFRFFQGSIDELRFWNVEKNQVQIDNSKGCALVGNEPNLVSYFNFNQGTASGNNTAITNLVNTKNTIYNGTFINMALNGATSNFVTGSPNVVGTCSTLATRDLALNADISIYPNPAKDVIRISNSGKSVINHVLISDINGRLIQTIDGLKVNSEKQISLTNLTSGVYFIKISSNHGSLTKKLMVE